LAALEKQAKNKEKQQAKVDILRASIIAKESESLRFFLRVKQKSHDGFIPNLLQILSYEASS